MTIPCIPRFVVHVQRAQKYSKGDFNVICVISKRLTARAVILRVGRMDWQRTVLHVSLRARADLKRTRTVALTVFKSAAVIARMGLTCTRATARAVS